MLNDEELDRIEARCTAASPGPWTSFVEGRDHWGGYDLIRVSEADDEPGTYVSRSDPGTMRPASTVDHATRTAQDRPRHLDRIDAIVVGVTYTGWTGSDAGDKRVRREFRTVLKEYGLPINGQLFDRTYEYVRENH